MLIKDNILVEKLNHTTKNISIKVELCFKLNQSDITLEFSYIPDKFKLIQSSIPAYLAELTKSEKFDLENLSARVIEDLYDIAVPKYITATLSEKNEDIATSITTSKNQPKFKI
ncbi:MAG TPA: hypothetical protein DCL21_03450 [Alphaproteobacteria bacterium]|nr:hypothetical protein [Alphaproteobacteria bacterium]